MVEGVVLEAEAPLVVGVLRLGGYVDRKGVCREGVTLVWEQKVEMESESLTKVGASPVMSTSGITTYNYFNRRSYGSGCNGFFRAVELFIIVNILNQLQVIRGEHLLRFFIPVGGSVMISCLFCEL